MAETITDEALEALLQRGEPGPQTITDEELEARLNPPPLTTPLVSPPGEFPSVADLGEPQPPPMVMPQVHQDVPMFGPKGETIYPELDPVEAEIRRYELETGRLERGDSTGIVTGFADAARDMVSIGGLDMANAADEIIEWITRTEARSGEAFRGSPFGPRRITPLSIEERLNAAVERENALLRIEGREGEIAELQGEGVGGELRAVVAQSVARTLPSLALGFAGMGPALGSMFFLSSKKAELDAIREGKAPAVAQFYGGIQGAIEAGTEAWAIPALFKKTGFGKKLIEFLWKEELSEVTATALQSITDWVVLNPEKSWEEIGPQLERDLYLTAAATPFSAGLQAGAVRGVQKGAQAAEITLQEYRRLNDESMAEKEAQLTKEQKRLNREIRRQIERDVRQTATEEAKISDQELDALLKIQGVEAAAVEEGARAATEAVREEPISAVTLNAGEKTGNLFRALKTAGDVTLGSAQKGFDRSVANFNKLMQWTAGMETIVRLNGAEGRNRPGVQKYGDNEREANATKSAWLQRGDTRIKQSWQRKVPWRRTGDFNEFLYEADRISEEQKSALTPEQVNDLVLKFNINPDQLQTAEEVWQDYRDTFSEIEATLIQQVQGTGDVPALIKDEFDQQRRIQEIRDAFVQIKNRNYMPRSSFGQWKVTAKATEDIEVEGTTYEAGETFWVSTHETRRAQKEMVKILQEEYGNKISTPTQSEIPVSDVARAFQGIPETFVESLIDKAELTGDQIREVELLMQEQTPASRLMRRLGNRVSTKGYSRDAQRGYAEYMGRFANQITRLRHDPARQQAIKQMEAAAAREGAQNADSQMRDWFKRHREYMNNPGNEYANLRALGFLWYLGGIPKSALINGTQPFIVTLPYLSKRYTEVGAVRAMGNAIAKATKVSEWSSRTPQEIAMIEELTRRGVVEESFAQELAANAAGSQLERFTPGNESNAILRFEADPRVGRAIRATTDKLAWMFHKMEVKNREITAYAAYELATNAGMNHAQAVNEAHEAVSRTQIEYSRFNRPEIMRGKKSVLFLFMQYLSNMMWFIGTDPSKWRVLGMIFLLAGLEGIPGMGNAMDLYDAIVTHFKKKIGAKEPKTQIRRMTREFVEDLWANPPREVEKLISSLNVSPHDAARMFTRGLTSDIGGFDVSGSLSLGRLGPLSAVTEPLARSTTGDRAIVDSLQTGAGAVAAIPFSIAEAVMSNNPDKWRTYSKAMPASLKNLSDAERWRQRGEILNARGVQVKAIDPEEDWPLLVGKAMGFQPAEPTEKRMRQFEAKDEETFYGAWRQILMDRWNWEQDREGNAEGVKAVNMAIDDFNRRLPRLLRPTMMITVPTKSRSRKDHVQATELERQFGTGTKKGIPFFHERMKERRGPEGERYR